MTSIVMLFVQFYTENAHPHDSDWKIPSILLLTPLATFMSSNFLNHELRWMSDVRIIEVEKYNAM